jgi:hypothetical protein
MHRGSTGRVCVTVEIEIRPHVARVLIRFHAFGTITSENGNSGALPHRISLIRSRKDKQHLWLNVKAQPSSSSIHVKNRSAEKYGPKGSVLLGGILWGNNDTSEIVSLVDYSPAVFSD